MKKKVLVFFCVLGVGITSWNLFKTKTYYEPIEIEFSEIDIPSTLVEIDGKKIRLDVDFGSKFAVDMRKDILETVENKKPHGTGHWKIPNGNEYEAPNYIVPRVKIGNLIVKDVLVQQLEDDSIANQIVWSKNNPEKKMDLATKGAIGRPLLQKFNFLFDFCRTRLIATNDFKKIGELGYFLHHMQKMPFTVGLMGINIEMQTKWGLKTFSIDTGASRNFIRTSLVEENDGSLMESGLRRVGSECVLSGRNLGSLNFYPYDLSSKLSDIDGVLGTPFLTKHILYIDFTTNTLYFRKSQEAPY